MAKVRIDYYGVEGVGKNVTEAKKDAGQKITKALDGSYNPRILAWKGFVVVLWREPIYGWSYSFVANPHKPLVDSEVNANSSGYDSFDNCRDRAAIHLAQVTWEPSDGTEPPPFLNTKRQTSEYESWVNFQLRCIHARDAGLSDRDCHDYAGMNPGRPDLPQLIARVETAHA